MVHARVGDDDQTRLLERTSDVIGKGTRGEASGDGLSTSVGGIFEDGAVAVWASRDDTNVIWVLDGSDNTGSENELLPGLADVEDVNTFPIV